MANDEKDLIRIYKSLNEENKKELIAYLLELYRKNSRCCNAGSLGGDNCAQMISKNL